MQQHNIWSHQGSSVRSHHAPSRTCHHAVCSPPAWAAARREQCALLHPILLLMPSARPTQTQCAANGAEQALLKPCVIARVDDHPRTLQRFAAAAAWLAAVRAQLPLRAEVALQAALLPKATTVQ
jgi:hypothetical protein